MKHAKPASAGRSAIFYTDSIAGFRAMAVYSFEENRLVSIESTIDHPGNDYIHSKFDPNPENYIADFYQVRHQLAQQYGKATVDTLFWYNDSLPKLRITPAQALSRAGAAYYSAWKLPKSHIYLALEDGGAVPILHLTLIDASKEEEFKSYLAPPTHDDD